MSLGACARRDPEQNAKAKVIIVLVGGTRRGAIVYRLLAIILQSAIPEPTAVAMLETQRFLFSPA
jgi:hypothetical protein